MKRWQGAMIAVLIASIILFFHRSTSSFMLQDSDTNVLIAALRNRHAPLSWFTGDWPLQNHFYRPISTLAFELDNAIYHNNAAGYGLTNALLCIACVWLLFWFLREFTDSPMFSGSAAVLFTLQQISGQDTIAIFILFLAIATGLIGLARHGLKIWNWLPAVLVLVYAQFEISMMGITDANSLGAGTIAWLPGRTATVMTVFALAAMAAYARYERLSADKALKVSTPLDPPATKSQKQIKQVGGLVVLWPLLSLIFTALALGSYEQAVMLPGVMVGIAIAMRCMGNRVRWGWLAGYWVLLIGYLVLRKSVLPPGASGYQLQQFRNGPGVKMCLLGYLLPSFNGVSGFIQTMESGLIMLLTTRPYMYILSAVSNLTALYQAKRRWVLALSGLSLSFIAYLPMAWVKTFAHYNYWPIAIRSIFTVTLLWIAMDLVVNAWSPQSSQAPLRLNPAPGSLPHP